MQFQRNKAETVRNDRQPWNDRPALMMVGQKGHEMKGLLTRKEMITACINDQITRGIIKPEKKDMQIKARLKGLTSAGIKAMSYAECLSWYEDVFETA